MPHFLARIQVEIILHIGTDKTGSTAIQDLLSRNRPWFLSRSVYIPATGFGRANGHALLLNALDPLELQTLRQELEHASAKGYRAALLSWEGMVKYKPAQIRCLGNALPDSTLRILIYLREQAEVIQSGHLQWVKMSPSARSVTAMGQPENPLQRLAAFLFLRHPGRNYHRTLCKWRKNMPDAAFSAVVFHKEQLRDGDIIADFLAQLSLKKDVEISENPLVTNPSLDVEAALLIESWRKDAMSADEIERLIDVAQSVTNHQGLSNRFFLDQKAVKTIRRHFRKSNECLARDFMDTRAYPFAHHHDCWRTDEFATIEAQATARLKKIEEVNVTPTLNGIAHGGDIWSATELHKGWSKPEDWGAWSIRDESVIRFRVLNRRIIGEIDRLRLTVSGHYYGNNTSTGISINGIDFGDQDLSDENTELSIPLDALLPYERVEIILHHHEPVSPFTLQGKKDNRPLAFALTAVGYTLLAGAAK